MWPSSENRRRIKYQQVLEVTGCNLGQQTDADHSAVREFHRVFLKDTANALAHSKNYIKKNTHFPWPFRSNYAMKNLELMENATLGRRMTSSFPNLAR